MPRPQTGPAVLAIAVVLLIFAQLPTGTRTGVDYVVTERSLPLYEKALAFLDRDIRMRALAAQIVQDTSGSVARALIILEWTHGHVRPVPQGVPVIDDHPLGVLIRGYGTVDQAADVFANLAAYSGIRVMFVFSRDGEGKPRYAFGLAEIEGAWRVFDVREGRAFRDRTGALAAVDLLRTDAALTSNLPSPREGRGIAYPELLAGIDLTEQRAAAEQMPLSRALREMQRMWSGLR